MTTIAESLRRLKIMDEVGSDNPLGREAADALDAAEKALETADIVMSHYVTGPALDEVRVALSKLRRTK